MIQERVCIWSERKTQLCRIGDHEDIEESDDGDDGQWRGANQTRSHGICRQDTTHKTHLCITGCSQARTAQLMRLAQELHCHLCAPKQVLSSGVTHVSSMVVLSRAFLHEHFLFFTYLSYLPHTENTQYIPHISKLPQSTSCAIKNHSGVKICTVAETRAQQLPQVMSPKNLRPSREAKHVLEIHIDDLMHRKNLEKKITEPLACKRAGGKRVCGGFRSELVSKRHPNSAELETVRISKSPTTVVQEDSTRDDEEAKSDFWTITGEFIYRHHVVPRVKLYVPSEETFPIPMKCIDVTRTTYTSLDVMLEQQIEDDWNVNGEKELSDALTRFTRFILLNERPPEGFSWSGERLTRKQNFSF